MRMTNTKVKKMVTSSIKRGRQKIGKEFTEDLDCISNVSFLINIQYFTYLYIFEQLKFS